MGGGTEEEGYSQDMAGHDRQGGIASKGGRLELNTRRDWVQGIAGAGGSFLCTWLRKGCEGWRSTTGRGPGTVGAW